MCIRESTSQDPAWVTAPFTISPPLTRRKSPLLLTIKLAVTEGFGHEVGLLSIQEGAGQLTIHRQSLDRALRDLDGAYAAAQKENRHD